MSALPHLSSAYLVEQAQKLGGAKKKKQVGLKKVGFCDLAGGFCDHFLIDFFHHKKMGGRRFEANLGFFFFFAHIYFCWMVVFWFHPRFFFFSGSSSPPKQLEIEVSDFLRMFFV